MTGPRIAVVGAGFTGLVAAYELRKRVGEAARIVLVDGADRVGGSVRPVALDGLRVDAGAESFLASGSEMFRLAAELGLTDRIVPSSGARPAVFADGVTRPLPVGTYFGLPTPDTRTALLGAEDFALIREDRPADWDLDADLSIAELVEPVYGSKVRTRLVDPLLSGVYAGDSLSIGVRAGLPGLSAQLDDQARGGAELVSLTKAVAAARAGAGTAQGPMFRSFDGGLGVLLEALCGQLGPVELRLGEPVAALERAGSGYRLDPVGEVDAVVLAVGAPALGQLLQKTDSAAAEAATSIQTASPVVVTMRCEPFDVSRETSGVLVAAGEGLGSKAITLTSNKWPHLDEAHVVRASFGRYGQDLSWTPDEQLLAWAASDFTRIFQRRSASGAGRIGLDVVDWAVERYPDALPQYAPWHSRKVAAIGAAGKGTLAVAGNFLSGVGLGACAATATAAAEQIAQAIEA